MIRPNYKFLVATALIGFAAHANAAAGAVTPALAACSKALIETISKDPLPAYTVKPASAFIPDMVDPHAFTVIAKNSKTHELLAKASCKATPAGEIVTFKSIYVKS
jgi:hypothetical protein